MTEYTFHMNHVFYINHSVAITESDIWLIKIHVLLDEKEAFNRISNLNQ